MSGSELYFSHSSIALDLKAVLSSFKMAPKLVIIFADRRIISPFLTRSLSGPQ